MKIIALWCRDLDNLIGINNDLPWHLNNDLKRFKRITEGKTIVVGQKTYESLPNRTLPNRKIIVITNDENYKVSDETNHLTASIKDNIIAPYKQDYFNFYPSFEDLYICGGATIYKLFMKNPYLRPDYIIDNIYEKHYIGDGMEDDMIYLDKNIDKIIEENYNHKELLIDFEENVRVKLHTKMEVDLENKIKG